MTAPESFVSRWARLKRGSAPARKPETEEGLQRQRTGLPDAEGSVQDGNSEVADVPFDPASLPSIEAITGDTDISAFLRSQVPAELTRAALRQAWASDPMIRDFIGIAENQWDFNDPNAMPGFGPLRAVDDVGTLLEQALGRSGKVVETVLEVPAPVVEQASSAVADHEPADLDQSPPQQTIDVVPVADADISRSAEKRSGEGPAIERDDAGEGNGRSRNRRSHGGALPR